MNITVTGANGFVGRSLIERLAKDDDLDVLGLSRSGIANEWLSSPCDWAVTDYSVKSLTEVFRGKNAVIHLAGIKGTKTDLADYDIDMRMTENILEAMTITGISRIIYASSRLVYGNPDNVPWTEKTTPEPLLAYAKNKVRCEKLCAKWAKETSGEALSLRIAQVLGVGEKTRNMINVFQDTARVGGEIKVIGKSVAKRQYIYTKDLAEILYRLTVSKHLDSGIMNVGMTKAYTNLEIAQNINKAFYNDTPIFYDDSQPETITPSIMDVSKMLHITGFTPMDMEQALSDIYSTINT